jgi:hypothetical protein
MNPLLKNYCVSVEFPDVSGAEHLEILLIRDRLREIESQLNQEEKTLLTKADRQLIKKVKDFYQELSRFVNLTESRKAQFIPPERWWWYLDVLALLPISFKQEFTNQSVDRDEVLVGKSQQTDDYFFEER